MGLIWRLLFKNVLIAADVTHAKNFINIDVSNWKTSNVTQAVNTFLDCKKLTQVAVQNWDMSNVSQLSGMFVYRSGITSLDISKWNAPKLIEINNTFNGLTKCTIFIVFYNNFIYFINLF